MAPKGQLKKRPAAMLAEAAEEVEDGIEAVSGEEEADEAADDEVPPTQPRTEPPRKQARLSFAERQAAHDRLMKKVAEFQATIKKMGKTAALQPQLALLKKTFNQTEMSCLWQLMSKDRKGADMTVKEAWDKICALKTGSREQKLECMMNSLVLPEGPAHDL